jgi:hypothetical protein
MIAIGGVSEKSVAEKPQAMSRGFSLGESRTLNVRCWHKADIPLAR